MFAAIGGFTAAVALLAYLPAAKADELADLKANQQLLEQRIEQLAQGGPPSHLGAPGTAGPSVYGTAPVPGAALVGGSFPRSFLIPGTDTSIRVGGFADLTMDYWIQNGPANGNQSTTLQENGNVLSMPLDVHGQTVPVPNAPGKTTPNFVVPVNIQHSRGNGVFLMSPRETRLNVETRTPTAYGEARTFIEFDFAGTNNFSGNNLTHVSDNLIPRLRYAYATLGGFLAGQANSNFSDPDANPETLDFGGPVGEAGVVRIPQVRYTYAGPWGSAWSASLETPVTDLMTPAGQVQSDTNLGQNPVSTGGTNCTANGTTFTGPCSLGANPTKSSAPDVTFASYWSQPWGHFDFRAVVRPTLQVNDGAFVDKQFVGYGGGISGDVKPGWLGWAKDDFAWQFSVGNGIGRYINETTDSALVTNFVNTTRCATPTPTCSGPMAGSNILVKPVFGFGATVGYQHWWLPNLRSNVVYGIELHDYSTQLLGPQQSAAANKQLQTIHVNLIWSPVAFIDTGIEYTWGQRKVAANIFGTDQALISKFRVKF